MNYCEVEAVEGFSVVVDGGKSALMSGTMIKIGGRMCGGTPATKKDIQVFVPETGANNVAVCAKGSWAWSGSLETFGADGFRSLVKKAVARAAKRSVEEDVLEFCAIVGVEYDGDIEPDLGCGPCFCHV